MKRILIGVDAGSSSSGLAIISSGSIVGGYNKPNTDVYSFIEAEYLKCQEMAVIIEDVRPYNMRITNGIIDTIKFIGQLEWRLKQLESIKVVLIPRWNIKQWVFNSFPEIVLPKTEKKIDRWASKEANKSKKRVISKFVWVDDRIIISAMREYWGIEKVKKVGERTPFNLDTHSWQALALCSYYLSDSFFSSCKS